MQGCRVGDPDAVFIDPFIEEKAKPAASSPGNTGRRSRPSTPASRHTQDSATGGARKQTKTQRQRTDSASSKPVPQGPRFFRLSPLVPFLTSRIYYLRSAIPASLFPDGKAVLEEVPQSYIASLAMSAGLVGMAGVRFPINMKKEEGKGPVEFMLDEDDE